jgi:tetratricopeptide (TPR) repeat protein
MRQHTPFFLLLAVTLPAFGQFPDVQIDVDQALARVDKQLQAIDLKLPELELSLQPFAQTFGRVTGDFAYDAGTRALDDRKYDEAILQFDRVIGGKSTRADGALYWKAYALNRLGRRDDALGAIAALRRDYPRSRWLTDAQALEVETRTNAGQPVSPADESNDDLKLIAINGLMKADPERAVPLLEGVLKGSSAPKLKDRAMFVLTQSGSARAQQVIADYAKGGANPDLQMRAIRYIGMSGAPSAQQQLASIYSATSDVEVKKEILRSLFTAGASERLLDVVRSEKDPGVRAEGIRDLSMTRGVQPVMLTNLYVAGGDQQSKREIIDALFRRGDAKDLVDLARKEKDPAMKKTMVERLSHMSGKEATDYMLELLK